MFAWLRKAFTTQMMVEEDADLLIGLHNKDAHSTACGLQRMAGVWGCEDLEQYWSKVALAVARKCRGEASLHAATPYH
jgi:hypothetical protein